MKVLRCLFGGISVPWACLNDLASFVRRLCPHVEMDMVLAPHADCQSPAVCVPVTTVLRCRKRKASSNPQHSHVKHPEPHPLGRHSLRFRKSRHIQQRICMTCGGQGGATDWDCGTGSGEGPCELGRSGRCAEAEGGGAVGGGVLPHRRHIHGNEAERPPSPALRPAWQTARLEKAVPCVTQGGGMRTAAEEGVDEG